MEYEFYAGEKLYRSIRPIEPFISIDGSITSGAFNDPNGLSVDRQMHRGNSSAVAFLKNHCDGEVYSVTTNDCAVKSIECVFCPIVNNSFHSELHKDKTVRKLTKGQARYLAKACKVEK